MPDAPKFQFPGGTVPHERAIDLAMPEQEHAARALAGLHIQRDRALEDYLSNLPTGGARFATVVVAASDSTAQGKASADFVCSGSGDQAQINAAIARATANVSYNQGGKVVLLEGRYNLSDSIVFGSNDDFPSLTVEGMGMATVIDGSSLPYGGDLGDLRAIFKQVGYANGARFSSMFIAGGLCNAFDLSSIEDGASEFASFDNLYVQAYQCIYANIDESGFIGSLRAENCRFAGTASSFLIVGSTITAGGISEISLVNNHFHSGDVMIVLPTDDADDGFCFIASGNEFGANLQVRSVLGVAINGNVVTGYVKLIESSKAVLAGNSIGGDLDLSQCAIGDVVYENLNYVGGTLSPPV